MPTIVLYVLTRMHLLKAVFWFCRHNERDNCRAISGVSTTVAAYNATCVMTVYVPRQPEHVLCVYCLPRPLRVT